MGRNLTVGVDGLTEQMSNFVTMGQACRRANISGNEELAVFDDNTATTATVAGGSFGGGVGQLHKVFVP